MINVDISLANRYLVCAVCKGYYVDPVTLAECTHPHTFCRNCLKNSLLRKAECPICKEHIAPNWVAKYTSEHCQSDRHMKSIVESVFPHIRDITEDGGRRMADLFEKNKAEYLCFVRKAIVVTVEPLYPTEFLTPPSTDGGNDSTVLSDSRVWDCVESILYDSPELANPQIRSKCQLSVAKLLRFLQTRLFALQIDSLDTLAVVADPGSMPRLFETRDLLQTTRTELLEGDKDTSGEVSIELLVQQNPGHTAHRDAEIGMDGMDVQSGSESESGFSVGDGASYTVVNPQDSLAAVFCSLDSSMDLIAPPAQEFTGAPAPALQLRLKYRYTQSYLSRRDVVL